MKKLMLKGHISAMLVVFVLGALTVLRAQLTPPPFSLIIKAQQEEVKVGSPIIVQAVMTNRSNRDVTIHQTSTASDYTMIVRDSQGTTVQQTPLGRMVKDKSKALTNVQRNLVLQLKPGESAEDSVEVSAFNDMKSPGTYKIQLERCLPKELGSGMAKSNVIVVSVIE